MGSGLTFSDAEFDALPDYSFSDAEFDSLPDAPPEDNSPSWISSLGISGAKGIGNVADGIAGLIDYGEKTFDTGTTLGERLSATQREYQQPREEFLAQVPKGSTQDYANQVTEGVTTMLPSLLSGYAPVSMMSQQLGLGAGRKFKQLQEMGLSVDDSQKGAAISGLANAALATPVLQTAQGTGPIAERLLFGSGLGAASGAAGTISDFYANAAATGEDVKPYEVKAALPGATLVGGLTGGLLPVASSVAGRISRGPAINRDALGATLESRLANRPPDSPEIPVATGVKLQADPEPIIPVDAPPAKEAAPVDVPEPGPVVKQTTIQKAPSGEDGFAAPLKPSEVEVISAGEKAPPPPVVEQTPETSMSSWQKLQKLAEPILARVNNSDINPLPTDQAWFEGRLYGQRKVPGIDRALSYIRNGAFPRTISNKFPEVGDAYYKGGRGLVETERAVASDLTERMKPYFNADNPALVDAFLGKSGEISLEFAKNGAPIPKFSDADLAAVGMTPKDIAAVASFRETMNDGLEVLRGTLLSKGRKINGADNLEKYNSDVNDYIDGMRDTNYFPARRYGERYSIEAKDAKGITTFRDHRDSPSAARKLVKELKKQGIEAKASAMPEIDLEGYSDMPLNMSEALNSFNSDKWTEIAKDRPVTGWGRHLIKKAGVAGYEENLQKSSIDYVLGLSKFAAREKASVVLDEIVNRLPDGNLKAYTKKYRENLLTGKDAGATRAALKFTNVMNLGAVLSSAYTNLTQTLTVTAPKMTGELSKVYGYTRGAVEAGVVSNRATLQSFAYLADRIGGKYAKGITRKIDPALFGDLDKAHKIGVIDAEGLSELYNLRRKIDGTPSLADGMMFMFSAAEKANRTYAFTAGREIGKAQGLKGDALFDYAKNFVETTQFDQTVANRSQNLTGGVARVVTHYKPFQLNYFRFLRDNVNRKDWPVVGLSLAATMSLGGAMALPFARLVEQAAGVFGFSPSKALGRWMGDEQWSERILYGLPTAVGIDMSGSMSTGEYVPSFDSKSSNNGIKLLGPLADYIGNRLPKAVDAYRTEDNPLIAAEIAAPRAIRGLLKAARGLTTGSIDNAKGDPVLENPTNSELGLIAGSFVPSRLGRENRFNRDKFELDRQSAYSPKDFNSLLADAINRKDRDRVKSLLQEMNDYNAGQPDSAKVSPSSSQIKKGVIEANQNPLLKMYKGAPKKERADLIELMRRYGKIPAQANSRRQAPGEGS